MLEQLLFRLDRLAPVELVDEALDLALLIALRIGEVEVNRLRNLDPGLGLAEVPPVDVEVLLDADVGAPNMRTYFLYSARIWDE